MDEQPQQIAQEQQEHQAPPAQAEQLVEAEAAPVEQQAAAPVKQEEQQQQQPEEPASVQEQPPVEPVKQEQEAAPVSETAQDVSMPQQTEEAAPAEAVALYDPEPAAVADEEPKRDRSRSRSPRRTFGAEGSRIEDSYRAGRDYDRPSQTARSRSPPRQFDGYRYQDPSAMPPSAPPAVIPGTFNPRPGGAAFNAPIDEAAEHAKHSIKENRVYVGNLSYDVRYKDLEQFMTDAGLGVVFTEILLTPQGLSKGCGIIEFASREDAQRAINEFSDKQLLGRPVFIREDREQAAKFGAPPSVGARAMMGGGGFGGGGGMGGNKLYIGNLPYQVGWQDLKDLFRPAGSIIRADIQTLPDGRPKGSGIVIFESPVDAANAIHQFNGFMWGDRRIEVREDRFAGPGGFRGGFRGGMGGGGHMGHMGGGHMGGGYPGGGHMGGPPPFRGGGGYGATPYGGGPGFGGSPHGGQSGFGGSAPGGFGGPAAGGFGGGAGGYQQANPESTQILVTNLPWSTSNEDLVELFETTGEVVAAEVLLEPNGRSRGVGVCEFVAVEQATSAIAKFTGYVYGGRALGLSYISRPHPFTPTAARSSA